MMHTSGLSFEYDEGKKLHFPDLQIDAGKHTLIIGASGSGKTTLLHLLAGLRRPVSGSVSLLGKRLQTMNSSELDKFRGKHIGMVFQVPHFIRSISVLENLTLAQSLAGYVPDPAMCKDLLSRLNLGDKANEKTHQLSVGEQQRVAIIRAIINQPDIILADEPTSALDDENTRIVIDLLQQQAEAVDATLIVVTHDQRLKDTFSETVRL